MIYNVPVCLVANQSVAMVKATCCNKNVASEWGTQVFAGQNIQSDFEYFGSRRAGLSTLLTADDACFCRNYRRKTFLINSLLIGKVITMSSLHKHKKTKPHFTDS